MISLREGKIAPGVDVMIGDVSNEYSMFVGMAYPGLNMSDSEYVNVVTGPSGAPVCTCECVRVCVCVCV